MVEIHKIRKRDGTVVEFHKDKITNAIFRAAASIGGKDRKVAETLADSVIEELDKGVKEGQIPTVEYVQDLVEKVLINNGHVKTAKAYIIYRQERAALRKEKMKILEKDSTDEVDKMFDLNSLRVLKSRYLRKSEDGKTIESPKQLFTRVAVHVTIPEIFYDKRVFSKEGRTFEEEDFDFVKNEDKLSFGGYNLNRFHLEGLKRLYERINKKSQTLVSWSGLVEMIRNGDFNYLEERVKEFYDLMVQKRFFPNTPAIANFGNPLGLGSACFVLGVPDSISGIMEALKNTAAVFKAGGGMGYNFSEIREEGAFVSTTGGIASGPLSFMQLFDKMTEVIKQGGIRRGANMGIMNSNHPDIEKFVTAKKSNSSLRNFNISVMLMDDFWECYKSGKPYSLKSPTTGKIIRNVNPKTLFDLIVYHAWESAEPGVLFFDNINKYNPFLESMGPIVSTNPCGEVLLYPNESCNLGSVNLHVFADIDEEGKTVVNWDRMATTVKSAVRLLDNIIDINKYPLEEIEDMTLSTRKVGLGVMGLGDLLYELQIPYNSDEGRAFMEKVMEFVSYHSKMASIELAKEKGSFPFFGRSFYKDGKMPFAGFYEKGSLDWSKVSEGVKSHGIRNGYTTVIAPTGSISMIAGCSSGMEPVYSLVFEKNVKVGNFYYVNQVFEKFMRAEDLYDDKLMQDIASHGGSIQNVNYMTKKMKTSFVTAMDIKPKDHIKALAAFQRWVDSSISKTINFPADATMEDMKKSYMLAYSIGCKGLTVYRDGSIKNQVLVSPKNERKEEKRDMIVINKEATELTDALIEEKPSMTAVAEASVLSVYASQGDNGFHGGDGNGNGNGNGYDSSGKPKVCPSCSTGLVKKEGCISCPECGWGLCA